jgi:hypothetical protein
MFSPVGGSLGGPPVRVLQGFNRGGSSRVASLKGYTQAGRYVVVPQFGSTSAPRVVSLRVFPQVS